MHANHVVAPWLLLLQCRMDGLFVCAPSLLQVTEAADKEGRHAARR